jgi:thiamine-monophosphate kinase
MLTASHVGGIIELASVPIHSDAISLSEVPDTNQITPLEHAMQDGEDFELLLAIPPQAAHALVEDDPGSLVQQTTMQPRIIGKVTEGFAFAGTTPDGQTIRLEPKGFEHVFE